MNTKSRILFVDDDPRCLEALRAQAGLLGDAWEAEFLDSAAKGLQAFAVRPFQVVVTDLHMPGMNGPEFLQEVMARYPATLRFLMAPEGDRGLAVQSLARTHQFLCKPCNLAYLGSALECISGLGQRVANDHVRQLVARIGQLPALPGLYREINELLDSERGSVENLGAVIGRDIAMTAMILKLANSAFFSLRHPVTSAAEAVSYLGIDLLKALVLAHGLFGQVGQFRIPTFTLQHLWHHSLAVGAAAKRIALVENSPQRSSDFFTAGLLHDIGILVLASRFPEEYTRVVELNRRAGGGLDASEFHVFGSTHGEVGAYLLTLWDLPKVVVEAAAWHHTLDPQAGPGLTPALAVHVANAMYAYGPEHDLFGKAPLDEVHLTRMGLADRVPDWRATAEVAFDGV
jgi:putative nucleotidyltransferase with HDIG domain